MNALSSLLKTVLNKAQLGLFCLFLLFTTTLFGGAADGTRKEWAKIIPIALTPNNSYAQHAGVSITSVMENSNPDYFYHFYVVHANDLSQDNRAKFASIVQKYPNSAIELIERVPGIERLKIDFHHWSEAAAYRLFFPSMPEFSSLDKLLYLDCDTVAVADVAELYDMPADGAAIIGIKDLAQEWHAQRMRNEFGISGFGDKEYICSGIMLMDLAQLRGLDFVNSAIDWMNVNDPGFPDQDAINAVLYGKIKSLQSLQWSYPGTWPGSDNPIDLPVKMYQYVGGKKPWKWIVPQNEAAISEVSPYHHYLMRSPWKYEVSNQPDQNTPVNIVFTTTNATLSQTGVTAASIMKHSDRDRSYKMYVVHVGRVSSDETDRWSKFENQYQNLTVQFINAQDVVDFSEHEWKYPGMLRMALPSLPGLQSVDKVVYVGSSNLCLGDITALWDIDLKDRAIVGAKDIFSGDRVRDMREKYGLTHFAEDGFINTNTMVMSLDKLRSLNFTEKAHAFIKEKNPNYYDLDAINAAVAGYGLSLESTQWAHPFDWAPQSECAKPKMMVYFDGDNKPWNTVLSEDCNSFESLAEYFRVRQETPWAYTVEPVQFSKEVHIALTPNNNYAPHAGVSMVSVMENASSDHFYHFYVVHNADLSESNRKKLKSIECDYRNCDITLIEGVKGIDSVDIDFHHWSETAAYRLFFPTIKEFEALDKILYLDCDTVANADVVELYEMPMNGKAIIGIRDLAQEWHGQRMRDEFGIHWFGDKEYICSGIMLMDLKQLRELYFVDRAVEWMKRNNPGFPDQDAINAVLHGKIKSLQSLQWSYPGIWPASDNPFDLPVKMYQYVGGKKPWHWLIPENKKAISDVSPYHYYRMRSPWAYEVNRRESIHGDAVDLVFIVDHITSAHAGVTAASILEHRDPTRRYHLHVVAPVKLGNEEVWRWKQLEACCKNVNVHIVDASDFISNTTFHWQYIGKIRMALPEIPALSHLDKVLYVHFDLVCNGDIAGLWDIDLGKNAIIGAKDIFQGDRGRDMRETYGFRGFEDEQFINTAFMLMSLNKLREINFTSSANAFIDEVNPKYYDLDAINAAAAGYAVSLETTQWAHPFDWAPQSDYTKPKFTLYLGDEKKPWNKILPDNLENVGNLSLYHNVRQKTQWAYTEKDNHLPSEVYIALTPDNNYMPHAGATATSVMENSNPNLFYHFLIVHGGNLSEENVERWNEFEASHPNCDVRLIDGSLTLNRVIDDHNIDMGRWKHAALYRLFFPDMEEFEGIERVLYLDCDVIAVSDVSELYNMPMYDKPMLGIMDVCQPERGADMRRKYKIEDYRDTDYVCSGILVLDLPKLNAMNFTEVILKWISDNRATFPDQDGINAVLQNQMETLHNFRWSYPGDWPLPKENGSDWPVKMFQYMGSDKPWKTFVSEDADYQDIEKISLYHYYLVRSPWYDNVLRYQEAAYLRDQIHVVLTPDANYMTHAGVTATSIIQAGDPNKNYIFHIYYIDSVTDNQVAAWRKLEEMYLNCQVDFVDGNGRIDPEGLDLGRWGIAGLLRISIPDAPEFSGLEKVIYVDSDAIAFSDIAELWNMPMDEKDIIAGRDINQDLWGHVLRSYRGLEDFRDEEYVNSGVLVMNLRQLRLTNFQERALVWLKETHANFPDQSAINVIGRGRIKVLHDFVWCHFGETENIDVKLMQYAGDDKPWKHDLADHDSLIQFQNAYSFIRQHSPWMIIERNTEPQPDRVEVESIVSRPIPVGQDALEYSISTTLDGLSEEDLMSLF